ncbi:hypothetical protein [Paenibacillus sp.]|uniref:hypothetical protein n=1 Tax=Paenibacillus sp. TaxID=58172 RepID=UPI0028112D89|nr:hypothetical protein [Paenibacillus sp.]
MNEPLHPETKLPQWHALLLESLKSYGWSNEELIRKVREGDLPKDESKFQFDYADLVAYAREHADALEDAIRHGYRVKYNTLRGIHSWIAVALRRDAELVLEPGGEAVVVPLSAEETRRVESMLSAGWKLSVPDPAPDANGRALIKIEPIHRI